MILDIRTLAIISNLVLLGSSLTMFAFWLTYRDRPCTGYWVLSLVSAFTGYLLIALRSLIPDAFSIIAANLSLTASFLFLFAGINNLVLSKNRVLLFSLILSLTAAGLVVFTYVRPSISSRIVLMSLMYIFLSVLSLYKLKRSSLGNRRNAGKSLAAMIRLFLIFMVIRLFVTLLSPGMQNLEDFVNSGNFQASAFIVTLFFYSGLTFTFIWINYGSLDTQRLTLLSAIDQATTSILITDSQGNIEYVNPAFSRKTGYSLRESIGRNTNFLKNTENEQDLFKVMWETINSGKPWNGEFYNRKKNGELYWDSASIAPVTDKKGRITHFVSVNEDITESKNLQDQLKNLANHDALTGLPSRRLVMDRLESAIELAERNEQLMGVLFADLDRFKDVNDNLGHEAGDIILQNVADLLSASLRKADTVARLGGDEFLIVLPQISDRDGASVVAQGLIDAIIGSDKVENIGLSVGIALYPEHGLTAKELIRAADNAMYSVKRNGRNHWSFGEISSGKDQS